MNPDFSSVEQMLVFLKKHSAVAGFAVSVMRQTYLARDAELSSVEWWELFHATKATLTEMVIRENWAAAPSAPKVPEECRWNQVKRMGHRSKEKLEKKKTLKNK